MDASRRNGADPLPARPVRGKAAGSPLADAVTKIAISEALLEAGGDGDGAAKQASNRLRRVVGTLLLRVQDAGGVRADVELPEVYALLVGTAPAAAQGHLDVAVTDRMLGIVFDGLTPRHHASEVAVRPEESPEPSRLPHRSAT